MVLSNDIAPEVEARLRQQAQASGKEMNAYVSDLVALAVAKPTFDEILAPLRRQFAQTGIGDDELIADITEAQTDYRAWLHRKPT